MAGTGLVNRDITLTAGGAELNGVITADYSITNSAIDVTDMQSGGFRELLAKGGIKQLDLAISGTVKDYELAKTMFSATQEVAGTIDLGDGVTTESQIACNFFLSELSFGGDANERVEYSATLLSSGTITFTDAT